MRINKFAWLLIGSMLWVACNDEKSTDKDTTSITHTDEGVSKTLPILGEKFIENGDTAWHTIPPFGLLNQHGDTITHHITDNKIHIADFFFTSCPGQCPMMTAALKRVQQNNKDLDFVILSYSIDPERDSVSKLKKYVENSGIDDYNWHFLTGPKEDIKYLGEKGYMAVSGVDDIGKGDGDNHSNTLYLIDKKNRIRGLYAGTDPEEVNQLIQDLRLLAKTE